MLSITKRGNRSCEGIGELGAGEAMGSVAGGCVANAPFEAPLVLAIVRILLVVGEVKVKMRLEDKEMQLACFPRCLRPMT